MRVESSSSGTMGPDLAKRDHARLVDATQQFEAMLLQEILKPLQSSENKWDKGDADTDKSADTMSAYGTEAVAKAISKAGGVGIGKRVLQQIQQEHDGRAR